MPGCGFTIKRMARKKQAVFRINTPAKVTPYLRILARRADGFHDVRIVLVAVSLFDGLEFRPQAAPGLELQVESAEPLGRPEDNLVYRAATGFQEVAGVELALRVVLRKHIPSGAGLGGGSGNAAGTLRVLNALHGHPLAPSRLASLAAGLGADVPFFLDPVSSLAEGRGERLRPLPPFPPVPLLVLKPPFAVSTAEAYARTIPDNGERPLPPFGTPAEVQAGLHNDFEATLLPAHPQLAEAKAALLAAGAEGALLTGSGSALFGVFQDRAARDAAAHKLRESGTWQVLPCEPLAAHTYLPGG